MRACFLSICALTAVLNSKTGIAEELRRADGGRYIGQVVEGKAEGQGVETRPDGTVYKGRFVKDAFVEGTMGTGGWVVPFSNCHSIDASKPSIPGK